MEITYKRPLWGGKKGPWIKRGVALLVILLSVGAGFMLSRFFPPTKGAFGSKPDQTEALYWNVSGAPQVGQEAPDLVFKSYEGKNYKLSDLRGKVVILNFWASWCPPCREEIPSMDAVYKELKNKGLVIVAVSINQGGKKDIDQFKRELPFSFPVALDPEAKAAKTYRVTSIPTTFIIDRQGKIADKGVGAVDWSSLKAKELLAKLLS